MARSSTEAERDRHEARPKTHDADPKIRAASSQSTSILVRCIPTVEDGADRCPATEHHARLDGVPRNSRTGTIANEAPTRAARTVGSRPVNARRSPPGEPSQRRNRTGPDHTSRAPRNYRLFRPPHPWGIDPNRVGRSRDPPTHRVRVIARTRIPVGFGVASDAAPPVRSRASARSVEPDRPRSPSEAR